MTLVSALSLALALGVGRAGAHDTDAHVVGSAEGGFPTAVEVRAVTAEDERARRYFTDRQLVTQHGERLRFYSDVLKDRVVLVTLFYTSCDGMCPLINQTLARVQGILGDEMGTDFWFVSISLDPEMDTAEVLRDYAANFDAGDGWLFLTGDSADIKEITRRLGQVNDQIERHVPYLLLGNIPRARWVKLRPNMPPQAVAERLRLLAQQ